MTHRRSRGQDDKNEETFRENVVGERIVDVEGLTESSWSFVGDLW